MKSIFWPYSFFTGILLFLSSCCSNYPDLDSGTAGKLKPSGIEGVWMAWDPGVSDTKTPEIAHMCNKACVSHYSYFGFLPYNYTVCRIPDFIVNPEVSAMAYKINQQSLLPLIDEKVRPTHIVRNKPMTGYNKIFCHTSGGPWTSELLEEEFCNICTDVRRYTLSITALPGNIQWSWIGSMNDAPPGTPGFNHFIKNAIPEVNDCSKRDFVNCTGAVERDPTKPPIIIQ